MSLLTRVNLPLLDLCGTVLSMVMICVGSLRLLRFFYFKYVTSFDLLMLQEPVFSIYADHRTQPLVFYLNVSVEMLILYFIFEVLLLYQCCRD